MRVALVAAGGVDRSGRERVIPALLWLIERLARRHVVHVFVLRHLAAPCTYQLRGAMVHDLGRAAGPAGLQSLLQIRHLAREIRRAGPFDVLHAYWAVPAGVLAACTGWWLRIPTVATFDSGELVCLPSCGYGLQCSWRGRAAVALTAKLATRLHVCSHYMAALARAAGQSVDRIPLGADPALFPSPEVRSSGPPWRLLHVASLNRVKDQPTLLRALARVVVQLPDVHLDIVGHDTLGGRVQAECTALGLDRHVSFHGFQPTDRLAPFYQRAHLLVLSSHHEAAGVVVLEAAASRLATIGSAVGYIADWAPEAAFAVPVGDDVALAEGILSLLGDTPRRERLAREAQRRARACDADWTAKAMERLYLEARGFTESSGGGTPLPN
jgi:glycosyltransferase involved in cell wall biosynthesis